MNLFSASILTLTPECILLINKVVAREKKIFKKNTFYSPGYNEKEDNLMLSSPYFFCLLSHESLERWRVGLIWLDGVY